KIHDWLKAQPSEAVVVGAKSSVLSPTVTRRVEATFTKSYTAHASLAPSCAVAEMKGGKLHVWSHTQGVYPLRRELAKVLKLDPQSIHVSIGRGRAATAITEPTTWRSTRRCLP